MDHELKVIPPEMEDYIPPEWQKILAAEQERSQFDETGGELRGDDTIPPPQL